MKENPIVVVIATLVLVLIFLHIYWDASVNNWCTGGKYAPSHICQNSSERNYYIFIGIGGTIISCFIGVLSFFNKK
jgi:hypothetical protein